MGLNVSSPNLGRLTSYVVRPCKTVDEQNCNYYVNRMAKLFNVKFNKNVVLRIHADEEFNTCGTYDMAGNKDKVLDIFIKCRLYLNWSESGSKIRCGDQQQKSTIGSVYTPVQWAKGGVTCEDSPTLKSVTSMRIQVKRAQALEQNICTILTRDAGRAASSANFPCNCTLYLLSSDVDAFRQGRVGPPNRGRRNPYRLSGYHGGRILMSPSGAWPRRSKREETSHSSQPVARPHLSLPLVQGLVTPLIVNADVFHYAQDVMDVEGSGRVPVLRNIEGENGGLISLRFRVFAEERLRERFMVLVHRPPERICHRVPDDRFVYMYDFVFQYLGVRFPLTDFEMGVLRFLDCAPTQVHPNGWSLIRALECSGVMKKASSSSPSAGPTSTSCSLVGLTSQMRVNSPPHFIKVLSACRTYTSEVEEFSCKRLLGGNRRILLGHELLKIHVS
ncbi:hypothetical protein RJT34_02800 [Clitoria ternatea]|uniref:Uncharacterized protein n=1 Tax=Clitoria ternatea TaxID=43366 RepID=A0AAN9KIK8_CLITE